MNILDEELMDQRQPSLDSLSSIRHELEAARRLFETCLADDALQQALADIAEAVIDTLNAGGRILLAGNGGSAADAQHIAGEFVSRFYYDRPALAGIALTTDSSVMTAIGNDYGFEQVFARQVRALGRAGDVFWGISTSGRSKNIVAALKEAREMGLKTVGFSGENPRDMAPLCDHVFRVPSAITPHIQQVHIVGAHLVCMLAEQRIFPRAAR